MQVILATNNAPELLLLDEPSNNLDLQSLTEMQRALANFKGALVVISHDSDFVMALNLTHRLTLSGAGGKLIEL